MTWHDLTWPVLNLKIKSRSDANRYDTQTRQHPVHWSDARKTVTMASPRYFRTEFVNTEMAICSLESLHSWSRYKLSVAVSSSFISSRFKCIIEPSVQPDSEQQVIFILIHVSSLVGFSYRTNYSAIVMFSHRTNYSSFVVFSHRSNYSSLVMFSHRSNYSSLVVFNYRSNYSSLVVFSHRSNYSSLVVFSHRSNYSSLVVFSHRSSYSSLVVFSHRSNYSSLVMFSYRSLILHP